MRTKGTERLPAYGLEHLEARALFSTAYYASTDVSALPGFDPGDGSDLTIAGASWLADGQDLWRGESLTELALT